MEEVRLEEFIEDDELLEMILCHTADPLGSHPSQQLNTVRNLALVSRRWRKVVQSPNVKSVMLRGIVYSFGADENARGTGHIQAPLGLPTVIQGFKGARIVDIAAGHKFALFVDSLGQVHSSGDSSGYRSSIPCPILSLKGVKALRVSVSEGHCLILSEAPNEPGKTCVYSFGSGRHGKLGHGNNENEAMPKRIAGLPCDVPIVQVAAGVFHSLVLYADGAVYAFGNDDLGQSGLGRGTGVHPYQSVYHTSVLNNATSPTRIEALVGHHVTAISAGEAHSLFLNQQGRVLSCGSDKYLKGLLGSLEGLRNAPCLVESLVAHHIVAISAGDAHSLAVTEKGELISFGSNSSGQLGLGKADRESHLPTSITIADETVVHVAAGRQISMAVTAQGHLYAFGLGSQYRLGVGNTDDQPSPTRVPCPDGVHVKKVSCSSRFGLALS